MEIKKIKFQFPLFFIEFSRFLNVLNYFQLYKGQITDFIKNTEFYYNLDNGKEYIEYKKFIFYCIDLKQGYSKELMAEISSKPGLINPKQAITYDSLNEIEKIKNSKVWKVHGI